MRVRKPIRVMPFAVLILAAVLLSGCGINTIPSYEQDAKAKWSEVQNQYKRRSDLIPNSGGVGPRLCRSGEVCPHRCDGSTG